MNVFYRIDIYLILNQYMHILSEDIDIYKQMSSWWWISKRQDLVFTFDTNFYNDTEIYTV